MDSNGAKPIKAFICPNADKGRCRLTLAVPLREEDDKLFELHARREKREEARVRDNTGEVR